MKKFVASLLAVATVLPCVACGGGGGDYAHLLTREDGDLYVRYFKGGNGAEWLYPIADAFEKETGINVYLECDDEITENIPTVLEGAHPTSGSPSQSMLHRLPDVCMTQTLKWQEYVNKGWIANIDEVYTYQYADEDNKTLQDKLIDGADKFGYMPETCYETEKHYWVVPWTSPLTGIVYNVQMLKGLGGKWANGYVPATVSELFELVEDLNEANITPFAWGGDSNGMGYWNFMFMSFWASYQGYETGYNGGRARYGGMMDFYNFVDDNGNMDGNNGATTGFGSFDQAGRKIALKVIQDLIVDTSSANKNDWTWKNSIDYPVSKKAQEAQDKFAFEEAAMIPTGSWIQNEIVDSMEEGFEYALMPTPAVDMAYVQSVAETLGLQQQEIRGGLFADGTFETTDNTGKAYAQINNTEIGDVMFIPKNATKKANAIKFLQFVNRQENVESATVDMGIARPFNYTPSALDGHSDFTKTVFAVYEKPGAVNLIRKSESSIFAYATIKEWAERNESDVLLQLASKSAKGLIEEISMNASDNWNQWLTKAGLN